MNIKLISKLNYPQFSIDACLEMEKDKYDTVIMMKDGKIVNFMSSKTTAEAAQ